MIIPEETIQYGRQKTHYLLKYKAFQASRGVKNADFLGLQPGPVWGWVLTTSKRLPN